MQKSLNLMWRFKWIPLLTLLAELLFIMPLFLLMQHFGESSFSFDSSITPFGSSDFIALLMEASQTDQGLKYSFLAFAFLLPAIFLFKLFLATGTMSILQQQSMNVSNWLSQGGQHFVRALGLFLRWIFIPIIWFGLCSLLFLLEITWLENLAYLLMGLGWMFALSWFYFALTIMVTNEKKSLRKAFKALVSNKKGCVITIIIFVIAMSLANGISLLAIGFEVNNSLSSTLFFALVSALLIRITIFFWQTSHVVMWLHE